MEEQQKIEIYEKALFIVKNSGKQNGIYFHLDKNGLDIFYSEYNDILTVYFNLQLNSDPVLKAERGRVKFLNDSNSTNWIDMINREFRSLMQNKQISMEK